MRNGIKMRQPLTRPLKSRIAPCGHDGSNGFDIVLNDDNALSGEKAHVIGSAAAASSSLNSLTADALASREQSSGNSAVDYWFQCASPANCCMNSSDTVLLARCGDILVSRSKQANSMNQYQTMSLLEQDETQNADEGDTSNKMLVEARCPSSADNLSTASPCCEVASHLAAASAEAFTSLSWDNFKDDSFLEHGKSYSGEENVVDDAEKMKTVVAEKANSSARTETTSNTMIKNSSKNKNYRRRNLKISTLDPDRVIKSVESTSTENSNRPSTNIGSNESGDHGKLSLQPTASSADGDGNDDETSDTHRRSVSECKAESENASLLQENDWPSLRNKTSPSVADSSAQQSSIYSQEGAVQLTNEDIPLPSFDYSNYSSVHGDSKFSAIHQRVSIVEPPSDISLQGIPIFNRALSQVRVTQVSANPLGGHVLLISQDGLLFSYGRNDSGQLGNGVRSSFYQSTPTIVTPLLENGGKTIQCAAGVTHSLVVVKTDGERIGRLSKSDPPASAKLIRVFSAPNGEVQNRVVHPSSSATMCHHQIYSFGQNDHMKLGLVNPKKEKQFENVLLPRRVAMHCKLWIEDGDGASDVGGGTSTVCESYPRFGIFKIAASVHHSAALVRRSTNAIELYTWGKADDYALGVPWDIHSAPYVGVPTLVQSLSYKQDHYSPLSPTRSTSPFSPERSSTKKFFADSCTGLMQDFASPDYPVDIELGPTCSIVVTSGGHCFSFGRSEDGLLGLGEGKTEAREPTEICFTTGRTGGSAPRKPENKPAITSVSIGARHALCVSEDGKVFSWGHIEHGRLGIRRLQKYVETNDPYFRPISGVSGVQPAPPFPVHNSIVWCPLQIPLNDFLEDDTHFISHSLRHAMLSYGDNSSAQDLAQNEEADNLPLVARTCAGLDSSVFIMRDGTVLSCGKGSGRLGQGFLQSSDVFSPKPLFGGLRLWDNR